jgi:hypothetical protein
MTARALRRLRLLLSICLLLNTATLTACLLVAFTGQAPVFLTPFSAMATTVTVLARRSLGGAR